MLGIWEPERWLFTAGFTVIGLILCAMLVGRARQLEPRVARAGPGEERLPVGRREVGHPEVADHAQLHRGEGVLVEEGPHLAEVAGDRRPRAEAPVIARKSRVATPGCAQRTDFPPRSAISGDLVRRTRRARAPKPEENPCASLRSRFCACPPSAGA